MRVGPVKCRKEFRGSSFITNTKCPSWLDVLDSQKESFVQKQNKTKYKNSLPCSKQKEYVVSYLLDAGVSVCPDVSSVWHCIVKNY